VAPIVGIIATPAGEDDVKKDFETGHQFAF
jgi:hypothetical protein